MKGRHTNLIKSKVVHFVSLLASSTLTGGGHNLCDPCSQGIPCWWHVHKMFCSLSPPSAAGIRCLTAVCSNTSISVLVHHEGVSVGITLKLQRSGRSLRNWSCIKGMGVLYLVLTMFIFWKMKFVLQNGMHIPVMQHSRPIILNFLLCDKPLLDTSPNPIHGEQLWTYCWRILCSPSIAWHVLKCTEWVISTRELMHVKNGSDMMHGLENEEQWS